MVFLNFIYKLFSTSSPDISKDTMIIVDDTIISEKDYTDNLNNGNGKEDNMETVPEKIEKEELSDDGHSGSDNEDYFQFNVKNNGNWFNEGGDDNYLYLDISPQLMSRSKRRRNKRKRKNKRKRRKTIHNI